MSAAALFSPNEELEDVPTGSLRYLSLLALEGRALASAPSSPDDPRRSLVLRRAAVLRHCEFLRELRRLGIYRSAELDAIERAEREEEEEEGEGGGRARRQSGRGASSGAASSGQAASIRPAPPATSSGGFLVGGGTSGGLPGASGGLLEASNPGARREAKIARFKRRKALKSEIEELASSGGLLAASGDSSSDSDEEEEKGDPNSNAGGERRRKLELLALELEALESEEALSGLLEEIGVLSFAAGLSASERTQLTKSSQRGAGEGGDVSDLVAKLREAAGELGKKAAAGSGAGAGAGFSPASRAAAGSAGAFPRSAVPSSTSPLLQGGVSLGPSAHRAFGVGPASGASAGGVVQSWGAGGAGVPGRGSVGAAGAAGIAGGAPLSTAAYRLDPRAAREAILRPGFVQPTYSVEQFGEQERKEAIAREQRQAEGELRERARREALGEEGREEEDRQKAVEWDAFKDDNPRGWGNSKNRPTGR